MSHVHMASTLVSVRIALCNYPPFVHALRNGTSFYGPWVNAVLEALTDDVAVTWLYLDAGACHQRDLTELLCNDDADIAIHPMLLGSMDRHCLDWSHPMDSTGLSLVDAVRVEPEALLFAPFDGQTWLLYAATIACFVAVMILLDVNGGRRRHVLRGMMALSGQMDVPADAHTAVYLVYTTFGIFTMLFLSVYTADLTSYLTSQMDQPVTRLKTLIDGDANFYVMSGAAELQMELDAGPLTTNLNGGYSIVDDPESRALPVLLPFMMSQKMVFEQCVPLRVARDELPPHPLALALRTGFAMNPQIQRSLRRRVLSGKLHNEMRAWIRTKYECADPDRQAPRPTLRIMWPIFAIAYAGMLCAAAVRASPRLYEWSCAAVAAAQSMPA
jgi:hypothetical protein